MWICLLSTIVLLLAFVTFANNTLSHKLSWWKSFGNEQWNFVRSFFQQGITKLPHFLTSRIIYAVWFLTLTIIITSFSAQLLSQYFTPPKFYLINSIEDLINSKNIKEVVSSTYAAHRISLNEV